SVRNSERNACCSTGCTVTVPHCDAVKRSFPSGRLISLSKVELRVALPRSTFRTIAAAAIMANAVIRPMTVRGIVHARQSDTRRSITWYLHFLVLCRMSQGSLLRQESMILLAQDLA